MLRKLEFWNKSVLIRKFLKERKGFWYQNIKSIKVKFNRIKCLQKFYWTVLVFLLQVAAPFPSNGGFKFVLLVDRNTIVEKNCLNQQKICFWIKNNYFFLNIWNKKVTLKVFRSLIKLDKVKNLPLIIFDAWNTCACLVHDDHSVIFERQWKVFFRQTTADI